MGDTKGKQSSKALKKKGSTRKLRTKNYIKENVKKLKQIQINCPKSEELDDGRTHDHHMSYAERLKIMTSNKIKRLRDLSIIKSEAKLLNKERKKVNVFTMKSRPLLNENNTTTLPEIKSKMTTKVIKRKVERDMKKEPKNTSNARIFDKHNTDVIMQKMEVLAKPQRPILNKETEFILKPEPKLEKKFESLNSDQYIRTNGSTNKKFEVINTQDATVISECSGSQFSPKAYKNEGCQVKTIKSTETIDSKTIVRFPRKSEMNMKEASKKAVLCEKSLQTEVKQNLQQSTPGSGKKIKPVKKLITTLTKDNPKTKEVSTNQGKDTKQQKTVIPANNRVNPPARIPVNKAKLKPNDEKANMLLTEIINRSNVNIKKLYTDIGKVQKTSPFARHHTVFESRNPDEIKRETSKNIKNNPNRDPGTIILPQHKKEEYLAQIKNRRTELLKQLNALPVNCLSLKSRQQKVQLGQDLDTLDTAIKLFSKDHLLIDFNLSQLN